MTGGSLARHAKMFRIFVPTGNEAPPHQANFPFACGHAQSNDGLKVVGATL